MLAMPQKYTNVELILQAENKKEIINNGYCNELSTGVNNSSFYKSSFYSLTITTPFHQF